MNKPKPPRIPRVLCWSFKDWLLQIPSLSLFIMNRINPTPEADQYFEKLDNYFKQLIYYKIKNRTCTREEWHKYRKNWEAENG